MRNNDTLAIGAIALAWLFNRNKGDQTPKKKISDIPPENFFTIGEPIATDRGGAPAPGIFDLRKPITENKEGMLILPSIKHSPIQKYDTSLKIQRRQKTSSGVSYDRQICFSEQKDHQWNEFSRWVQDNGGIIEGDRLIGENRPDPADPGLICTTNRVLVRWPNGEPPFPFTGRFRL